MTFGPIWNWSRHEGPTRYPCVSVVHLGRRQAFTAGQRKLTTQRYLRIGSLWEIVPWCEVSGVKKVSYTSPEGTHEGVVVGLNSAEHFPYAREHTEHITREIKKLIPADEFDVCFVLTHDD